MDQIPEPSSLPDMDRLARLAYEAYVDSSVRPDLLLATEWDDLPGREQAPWRAATAAVLADYDPEGFGRALEAIHTAWHAVKPVIDYLAPLVALLPEEDTDDEPPY
jgi:hypothetical protein